MRRKGLLLLFNATVSKKKKELLKAKLNGDCTLACIIIHMENDILTYENLMRVLNQSEKGHDHQ